MVTTTTTKCNSRKRCRSVVGMGMALAALCLDSSTSTLAFSTPPTVLARSGTTNTQIPALMTPLQMVSSSTLRHVEDVSDTQSNNNNNNNSRLRTRNDLERAPDRLSFEEQKELLRDAVELRRLKNLEAELALRRSNKKSTPLLLVRAQEAGYGDDIVAYENAVLQGERAREQLITTNMGLVHFCVNEIIGTKKRGTSKRQLNSLSREDLIQEGAIGLARAIDRWNPAIGGKFSTYAVYWVRACILRCIAEKDDMLRVPEHVSTAVRKMTRGAQKLGLDIDGDTLLSNVYSSNDANWKEAQAAKALAEEAGLTDKQLAEAMRIRYRRNTGGYVAYESWMQKGQDIESDISTVASREDPLRSVEVGQLKKTLGRYLRPKEMEALFLRYGLVNDYELESAAKPAQPKNYLAQAEEELYGKPTKAKTTAKSRKTKASRNSKAKKATELPVRGKWGEAMSFTEVGKRMEVSAEYGRRLCHGAIKKLRQAAADGLLEPALLF